MKLRAPVLGGNFGVWGGLFSTFDCSVKGIRKKEDPYNAIIAGFFTGGALAVRGGYKAMRNGAIGCAVLLAVIEGVGIGIGKYFAGNTKLEVSLFPMPAVCPGQRMGVCCSGGGLLMGFRRRLLRGPRGQWPDLSNFLPATLSNRDSIPTPNARRKTKTLRPNSPLHFRLSIFLASIVERMNARCTTSLTDNQPQ